MKAERPGGHFPALTGLRFVLALWVILFHLTRPGQMLEWAMAWLPAMVAALINGGYLAVTTFFVLSGFVLARSYRAERWSRRDLALYGAGRVARAYPLYLLSLMVVAPIIAADRVASKGAYLAAHLALVQGWLGTIPVNWNTPAWALSCEMFFYVIFPVAGVVLARTGWRGTLAWSAAAIALTRVLWAVGVPDWIKPVIHLSDFLMGMAASRVFDLMGAWRWRPAGTWIYAPALAVYVALIAYPGMLPARIDLNTAFRPLNAALMIGLALGGGTVARVLGLQPMLFLGKTSYAMYILHVPLLWWYPHTGSAAVFMVGLIAISAVMYQAVEEPANRYLRDRARAALQA